MATNPYAAIAMKDQNPYASIAIKDQPTDSKPEYGTGLGIDPHQVPHTLGQVGHEGLKALSNIGAGGLGLLSGIGRATPVGAGLDMMHDQPTIYEDAYHAAQHPINTLMGMGKSAQQHPLETLEQGIGAAGVGGGASLLAEPETAAGLSSLNQKVNPLPLRSRAVNKFNSVAEDVGDIPVQMKQTAPAIQEFQRYARTGGMENPVIDKLVHETSPNKPPLSFTDAQDFAKNVGRDARSPNLLKRLTEDAKAPDMRRNLGPVQKGLKGDLTDTAEQVGRGEDFTDANREYANNAKLRRLGLLGAKAAGAVGAEEVARRTGLLGKVGRRLIP